MYVGRDLLGNLFYQFIRVQFVPALGRRICCCIVSPNLFRQFFNQNAQAFKFVAVLCGDQVSWAGCALWLKPTVRQTIVDKSRDLSICDL